MALNFKLSLGDYAALGVLLLTAVGGQLALSNANISTAKAELSGQMDLIAERTNNDRDQLRRDFATSSAEIKVIVQDGLKTRSDEVGIAIARMTGLSKAFVVSVANMPVGGEIYANFQRVASRLDGNSKVLQVNDVALGNLYVDSLDNPKAALINSLVEGVPKWELDQVEFRVGFDDRQMTRTENSEAIIRAEIERLEDLLTTLSP